MSYEIAELEEAARKEALYAAKVFAQTFGMNKEDREDLEQDLLLAVILKAASYDKSKAALRTFAAAVIQNEILHRIRDIIQEADKPASTVNLYDEVFDGEDYVSLHETLDRAKCRERMGLHELNPFIRADLRHDLALVTKHLTPRQRNIFLLLQIMTKKEAAAELGVSRYTVHQDVKGIREIMNDMGFDSYKKST